MDYYPDSWAVVKITEGEVVHYRLVTTFFGGYPYGDHWRYNSGITGCVYRAVNGMLYFYGLSGSTYVCHPKEYGVTSTATEAIEILKNYQSVDSVEVLPKTTDWLELDYGVLQY